MVNFEYAIFDMDGTLVDSMKQWRETGSIFLRKMDIEPTRELISFIRKQPYAKISEMLSERFGIHYTGVELENEFFKIMKYSYRTNVYEKNGVFEYLDHLREMEIPMCVATGTCQELTQYILEKLNLKEYFEFIITCPEVGEDKHSPLIFEKALERIGGEKENTMIFEDSLTAIKAATNVGFRTIGVFDETYIQDKRAIKKLAEEYVYSLAELKHRKCAI